MNLILHTIGDVQLWLLIRNTVINIIYLLICNLNPLKCSKLLLLLLVFTEVILLLKLLMLLFLFLFMLLIIV